MIDITDLYTSSQVCHKDCLIHLNANASGGVPDCAYSLTVLFRDKVIRCFLGM